MAIRLNGYSAKWLIVYLGLGRVGAARRWCSGELGGGEGVLVAGDASGQYGESNTRAGSAGDGLGRRGDGNRAAAELDGGEVGVPACRAALQ